MYKNVLVFGIVLAIAGSASALYVNDTQVWGDRTAIQNLSDKTLEIGPNGNLTINNRVDLDEGAKIVMSGGILDINGTCKFPDSSGSQNVQMFINEGTMETNDIESRAYDRGDAIYMHAFGDATTYGGGVLRVLSNYGSGNREYDPVKWLADGTLVPPTGETIVFTPLGGGAVEITATPEPATIALLGLGCLALIRKRR